MDPQTWATLGGALALVGGMAGSATGMSIAAASGTATMSEDPGQFRNVVVLAALPVTQTFYALIVTIVVITSVIPKLPATGYQGIAVFGVCFISFFAELISAREQGIICASGISLLNKTKGQIFTSTLLLAAYVELEGVLGLVFCIMIFSLLGLM